MDANLFLLFVVTPATIIGGVMAVLVINSNKVKRLEEHLQGLANFDATQKLLDAAGNSGIAIDENRSQICLIGQEAGEVRLGIMPYRDVLSVEIVEDGVSVTRSSRKSQIGNALIGGLAFGTLGAVVGGMTGNRTTSQRVRRIDLKLIVNRTDAPIHLVNLMNAESATDGILYRTMIEEAKRWHALVSVIIKRADEQDSTRGKSDATNTASDDCRSPADELRKLASLRADGILTDAEFQSQKRRLLDEG